MLPSTVERVPINTDPEVNNWIYETTRRSIEKYQHAGPAAIDRRLRELEHEWDIERTLEANAATASLVGLTLGATVDKRWFFFPAVVAGFLLMHALQGWCPPVPIFRRMGMRTSYEIEEERHALMQIRQTPRPRTNGGIPEEHPAVA